MVAEGLLRVAATACPLFGQREARRRLIALRSETPEGGEPKQARSSGLIDRRRDARRNLVGGVLDGIGREVRIPSGRLDLCMPE